MSISSSTKWERDAAADLKYLRGLPTAPSGATIYGTLFCFVTPESPRMMIRKGTPEVGHKVEVQGTWQKYEATVDSRGKFKISGLPAGRYTIFLNADGELRTVAKSTTVDVADKGCARFDFWIDPFKAKKPAP